MREPDDEIPEHEPLFLLISVTDLDPLGHVQPEAIDFQGTSIARSSYIFAHQLPGTRRGPAHNGVAEITRAMLPTDFEVPPSPNRWDWIAVDCPEVVNGVEFEDHAELRPRKAQDRPSKACSKPPGDVVKRQIKNQLAKRLTIRIQPQPVPPA